MIHSFIAYTTISVQKLIKEEEELEILTDGIKKVMEIKMMLYFFCNLEYMDRSKNISGSSLLQHV